MDDNLAAYFTYFNKIKINNKKKTKIYIYSYVYNGKKFI